MYENALDFYYNSTSTVDLVQLRVCIELQFKICLYIYLFIYIYKLILMNYN